MPEYRRDSAPEPLPSLSAAAILVACCVSLCCCRTGDGQPTSTERGIGIPLGRAGFTQGMVATSEVEPAEAAARVLERGGNAIDAAIAAEFVLNVVEPQSSGIGGGGFMMIYLAASKETLVVDSRETAPAVATRRMFVDPNRRATPFLLASTSGYAVGVPGALRGAETALARWGTMSLADALAPAIEAAEKGVIINPRLAESTDDERLRSECDLAPHSSPYAIARTVFRRDADASGCGKPLASGDRLVQPDLAKTFRLIAAEGTRAFYDCEHPAGIARAIVTTQKGTRAQNDPAGIGRMTCDDLAAYRVAIRKPVVGDYRGYRVESVPLPSSGGLALLQALKELQRFPIGDAVRGFGFGSFDTLGVMLEAMRLSFADRAVWMGDPDLMPELPARGLIDDDYVRQRAGSCSRGDPSHGFYCVEAGSRLPQVRAGDPRPFEKQQQPIASSLRAAATVEQPEGTHTTHITVADAQGNLVSFTTTIESPWGTGLMVPGFGFMLNNELTDFNLVPQRNGLPDDPDYDPGANDVAPFKRPRSSMAPTMIFARGERGERPVAAYGSPGGSTIINTVLNVTLDLVDHHLPIRQAIERPRISLTSAAEQATTSMEAGFDAAVHERLRALGYRIAEQPVDIGAVQAIVIDPQTGALYGEADPRRNGTVIGLPRQLDSERR